MIEQLRVLLRRLNSLRNVARKLHNPGSALLIQHECLLRDGYRNTLFLRALQTYVDRSTSVLDIGTGSGIWAMTAAMLGAPRVVAVERQPYLIPIIRQLVRENGFEGVVEVVCGEFSSVRLKERFDLIVSEMVGNLGYEEQIVPILIQARRDYLKDGGKMIPSRIRLMAAPAYLKQSRLPIGVPNLDFSTFERMSLHLPTHPTETPELLAQPQVLLETDLMRVESAPDLNHLGAVWSVELASRVNCFILWVEIDLAPGLVIETLGQSHWMVTAYRIEPFPYAQGQIQLQISPLADPVWWEVSLPENGKVRRYSPALV